MKTKHVLKKYNIVCREIAGSFVKTYFCDKDISEHDIDLHAIGGEIDGMYDIESYYCVLLRDMVTCLRLKIPKTTFFAWYDQSLEAAIEDKTYANLENYYLMTKNTL